MRAEGYAKPRSIKWMDYCVRRFFEDVALPATMEDMEPAHLLQWTEAMKKRALKPGAIRSYQSAVWAWLGWSFREGYLPQDLARRVRKHRPDPNPTRRTAQREHVYALVDVALDRSEWALRNAALILTLASTGARRAELAMTTMADLHLETGSLRLLHTKTDKPRTVGIDEDTKIALMRYIHLSRGTGDGPLFIARQKRALTSDGMRCVIRSLVLSARDKYPGLQLGSHDLRRLCGKEMLEGGVPLDSVQQQLGHATPAMTLMYGEEGRDKRLIEAYHRFDRDRRRGSTSA